MKSPTALKTACNTALLSLGALCLTWLSGCSALKTEKPPVVPAQKAPERPPQTEVVPAQRPPEPTIANSAARNPKEYRKDAAQHLYAKHRQHIYKGRLPPLLEAVGVLNVDIDRQGAVKTIHWMRAPRHVPHVMGEIERLVKAAAPYPVPKHLGHVTYTDVWLWHKSGQFQLDTLTEGQD